MTAFNATDATAADQRLMLARAWVRRMLPASRGELEPVSGDASFRRYFRVGDGNGQTRILMDAPPQSEPLGPFLRAAEWLADCGLHVPEVVAADAAQGFALLADLGSCSYLDALCRAEQADGLYRDALDALIRLQANGHRYRQQLPSYGHQLLWAELELFREWCCRRYLGLELSPSEQRMLNELYARLCRSALAQPQVFVHRDYHSRNLMVVPRHNPGVLDFQDAVWGPLTYDLVSLLKDCYVAWPEQKVNGWLAYYHERAVAAGLPAADFATLRSRADWMGVQRHLKAAGIFARLRERDGKGGYVRDIPRTLGYVVTVSAGEPELTGLHAFLEHRVMPRLAELRRA